MQDGTARRDYRLRFTPGTSSEGQPVVEAPEQARCGEVLHHFTEESATGGAITATARLPQ